ncbi:Uncharacterised protein [Streptococcus pneumoniae]|nr:Uncharacterised protein [Streptococcus pneumoniae]CGF62830.1 Uncharacterised protein [Streptococcus pneumoniae]
MKTCLKIKATVKPDKTAGKKNQARKKVWPLILEFKTRAMKIPSAISPTTMAIVMIAVKPIAFMNFGSMKRSLKLFKPTNL